MRGRPRGHAVLQWVAADARCAKAHAALEAARRLVRWHRAVVRMRVDEPRRLFSAPALRRPPIIAFVIFVVVIVATAALSNGTGKCGRSARCAHKLALEGEFELPKRLRETVCGTPLYMSPEAVTNHQYTLKQQQG